MISYISIKGGKVTIFLENPHPSQSHFEIYHHIFYWEIQNNIRVFNCWNTSLWIYSIFLRPKLTFQHFASQFHPLLLISTVLGFLHFGFFKHFAYCCTCFIFFMNDFNTLTVFIIRTKEFINIITNFIACLTTLMGLHQKTNFLFHQFFNPS